MVILTVLSVLFSRVVLSHLLMSNFLWSLGLQPARPPCPSPTPRVCSNSCPVSRWCHPTVSSSVVPFSSCPQSFPASRSFPISQFFASGGQSFGASASYLLGTRINILNRLPHKILILLMWYVHHHSHLHRPFDWKININVFK